MKQPNNRQAEVKTPETGPAAKPAAAAAAPAETKKATAVACPKCKTENPTVVNERMQDNRVVTQYKCIKCGNFFTR